MSWVVLRASPGAASPGRSVGSSQMSSCRWDVVGHSVFRASAATVGGCLGLSLNWCGWLPRAQSGPMLCLRSTRYHWGLQSSNVEVSRGQITGRAAWVITPTQVRNASSLTALCCQALSCPLLFCPAESKVRAGG